MAYLRHHNFEKRITIQYYIYRRTIIDGKATAATIKQEIAAEVAAMAANGMKRPHLAAILVGHDGGSETYVRNKVLACEACGF